MMVFDAGKAARILNGSGDVDAFLRVADASDVAWWRVNTSQKNTLIGLAQKKDEESGVNWKLPGSITSWVKGYCLKQSVTVASKWVNSNVIPGDKHDRAGWLNYYLMECTMDRGFLVSKTDSNNVEDALNMLASKNPEGVPGAMRLKTGSKAGSIGSISDARLRDIMTIFLKAGFDSLPGSVKEFNNKDTSRDHLMNFVRKIGGNRETLSFCWRADTRSFQDIVDDGGFQAKCNSKNNETLVRHNLDKAWHPFQDASIKKFMWFRKGQKDNCLYSVISIGNSEHWKDYLSFPLVRDHKSWNMTDKKVLVKKDGSYQSVTLGVSWTYLYLFVLSDLILADTEKIQEWITAEKLRLKEGKSVGGGAFPERAARAIPMENIFGAVKIIRIHHADKATADDDHGFTARPVSYHLNYTHALAIKERWGVEADKLETEFMAAFRTDLVHRRWSPTGSVELPTIDNGLEVSVATFSKVRVGP